jgi:hypothetical protein
VEPKPAEPKLVASKPAAPKPAEPQSPQSKKSEAPAVPEPPPGVAGDDFTVEVKVEKGVEVQEIEDAIRGAAPAGSGFWTGSKKLPMQMGKKKAAHAIPGREECVRQGARTGGKSKGRIERGDLGVRKSNQSVQTTNFAAGFTEPRTIFYFHVADIDTSVLRNFDQISFDFVF